jgi:hypothetical protein
VVTVVAVMTVVAVVTVMAGVTGVLIGVVIVVAP